jgi:hypothetical protein
MFYKNGVIGRQRISYIYGGTMANVLRKMAFIKMKQCGHEKWREQQMHKKIIKITMNMESRKRVKEKFIKFVQFKLLSK